MKKVPLAVTLLLYLFFCTSQYARAQMDPRQVLAGMITQVQTGALNPQWYGQQLWQMIALQTGNTGIYQPLVQLGPVLNVVVTQQQQLPQGSLFAMTAQHSFGQSTWILGVSSITNRIEYANFNVGTSTTPFPLPTPSPSPNPQPNPAPTPSPSPGSESQACKKFPNLC